MPIGASNRRVTQGQYENRQSAYLPDRWFQNRNNSVADAFGACLPQQCDAKSAFFTALILTHVTTIATSQARLSKNSPPPAQKELPASEVVFGPTRFPHTIPAFSSAQAIDTFPVKVAQQWRHMNSHPLESIAKSPMPSVGREISVAGLFPGVHATPDAAPVDNLLWHEQQQFFTIDAESTKTEFIDELVELLVKMGKIDRDEASDLALQWRQQMIDKEIYIFPMLRSPHHSIEKRRSFKEIDEEIKDHITEHCVAETEIVDTEGRPFADVMIYHLDKIDEFLNAPDSTLRKAFNGPPVSSALSHLLDNAGMIVLLPVTILTSPFLPLLGNFFRGLHYWRKGDSICLRREIKYALANTATSLGTGALGKFSVKKVTATTHNLPLQSDAFFFAKNKQTGAKTEMILRAKSQSSQVNQLDDIVIRSETPSRYTGASSSQSAKKNAMPIIFDEQAEIWRQAQHPHAPLLNVELKAGRTYVNIRGKQYPLRMTNHMQYQVAVKYPSGKMDFLPVYRDQVSKKWHLKILDHKPVFSPADEALIDSIKLKPDRGMRYELIANVNPSFYKQGQIVKVSEKSSGAERHQAVEMNGEMVPVQQTTVGDYGVRYDTQDLKNPRRPSQTVIWDGDRWSLEPGTSPYVSASLKKHITPEMYVDNVNIYKLSAPDSRGLRWTDQGDGFLKVKNEFVRAFPEQRSSLKTASGAPLHIIFVDGKFRLAEPLPIPIPPAVLTGLPESVLPVSPTHPEDRPTAKRFNTVFKHLLEGEWVPELGNTHLIESIRSFHPDSDIKVQQVPSSGLQVVRTVMSIDDEKIIMDISNDGKIRKILGGHELLSALTKLKNRGFGGEIDNVISLSLKRPTDVVGITIDSQAEIERATRNLISNGHKEIKNVLSRLIHPEDSISLILGNDDFFHSGTFALNSYADPKAVYESLIEYFIPLSRAFPNVIIAPGSIYLSTDIPLDARSNELKYMHKNTPHLVQSAVHFSSVISPVFFAGEIVTIARKGDYLTYETPENDMQEGAEKVQLTDLSTAIPRGMQLNGQDESAGEMKPPRDQKNDRTGTIFSGQTLLPGEASLTKTILQDYMANRPTQAFFQSEFVIRNEKYLFVIGNEFKERQHCRQLIQKVGSQQGDKTDSSALYDWILHTGTSASIDNRLRAVADNYLQANDHDRSEYLSAVTRRFHAIESLPQSDMIVHYFDMVGGD